MYLHGLLVSVGPGGQEGEDDSIGHADALMPHPDEHPTGQQGLQNLVVVVAIEQDDVWGPLNQLLGVTFVQHLLDLDAGKAQRADQV
jgi:hypothetical protein